MGLRALLSDHDEHLPRAEHGPPIRGRRVCPSWPRRASPLVSAFVMQRAAHLSENTNRRRYRREHDGERLHGGGRSGR
jgi:hypothetical protein